MKILVVGATGATGRLLVKQLLDRDHTVSVIVRSQSRLPEEVQGHENLIVKEASILKLSDAELQEAVAGCDAIACCLGHNISVKGILGPPYKLVTDATRRLCEAAKVQNSNQRTKFVLMNTIAYKNPDLSEPMSVAERAVFALLRLLLPPQSDNEQAAEYLRTQIGQNDALIEWVAVRPDSLINLDAVSPYSEHSSPAGTTLFKPGKTSRINVAHFMAELATNDALWQKWKGQTPVIYNKEG